MICYRDIVVDRDKEMLQNKNFFFKYFPRKSYLKLCNDMRTIKRKLGNLLKYFNDFYQDLGYLIG